MVVVVVETTKRIGGVFVVVVVGEWCVEVDGAGSELALVDLVEAERERRVCLYVRLSVRALLVKQMSKFAVLCYQSVCP